MGGQARTSLESLQRRTRKRLADNLRAQRVRLELTQERAAERTGFSLQYYQRIERCIVNVPLDTISRLAHVYGVDPADLLAKSRKDST
jgi:transcriptional regulator with XRE-family HTH domain